MPQDMMTSYSDVTPQKRVITDVISLIDPADTPLIEALGGLDGAESKFRFANWPSTTVEWLEDTLAPLADQLNGSITSSVTTITVDDADKFQEGHIIFVGAEQMWVSAVNVATEVLTVTRGYAGTQTTQADNAVVEIIGMARIEGADSDPSPWTDRVTGSNFTEIFHKEIKVTRTQNQISQYGIAEEFDYQSSKAVPELARLIEKQMFRGARKAGTGTTPRAFGGFSTFITDNSVNAGGPIVQTDFDDALLAAYNDGGLGPWLAPMTAANMRVVKNFYDTSGFLRVDREEKTVGMVIERIATPFGMVDLLLDRWAESARVNLIDPKHAGLRTYYPFTQEPLAKDGDHTKGEVIGEFVLCVRQDKAHAFIGTIS